MNNVTQLFELRQTFRIESARFLPQLPEEHPCRRLHGHSFEIEIRLIDKLDPKIGWVIDYHDIHLAMGPILKKIDHTTLNEVSGLENPTTEILTKWIYDHAILSLPMLKQVIIRETYNTECRYPIINGPV